MLLPARRARRRFLSVAAVFQYLARAGLFLDAICRYIPRATKSRRRPAQTIDLSSAEALMPELHSANAATQEVIPRLHEARRRYAQTQSDEDRIEHDRVQQEAEEKHAAFRDILKRVQDATGIPEEVFEALSAPDLDFDPVNRTRRSQLTVDQVETTSSIDDALPNALGALLRQIPAGWLEEESAERFRLPVHDIGRPVSIVKGVRPESESPPGHRLRQAIQIARDFLSENARYDHFGGAMLVPQIARLGGRLGILAEVANSEERITNLWRKPAEVDTTTYELLVAAALAEKGRQPSFIPETQEKTPDIRCVDPFPLVVEIKRRQALAEYEQQEEGVMRSLFARLETEARRRGLYGVFELRLTLEVELLDPEEIVAKAMLQRLTPHPDKPLPYPWGSVAFREVPRRIALPEPTKAYSPDMLGYAFDWNSDLPQWDGLVCKAATAEGVMVDEVCDGIALAWSNFSPAAVNKRSRPPTSLFGSATKQMPGGEFGIVYLAYNEGAREEIADLRVQQVADRLNAWEHSAMFRIPVSFLTRLYPRALGSGRPDLIESTINFYSEVSGGEPWFFEAYPSRIFTPRS